MVKRSQINYCVLSRFSSVPITKEHHDLLYTTVCLGILLPDVSFSTEVEKVADLSPLQFRKQI